jgi:hypothetical protein
METKWIVRRGEAPSSGRTPSAGQWMDSTPGRCGQGVPRSKSRRARRFLGSRESSHLVGHPPPSADELILQRSHRRQQRLESAALEHPTDKGPLVPQVPQLVSTVRFRWGRRDDRLEAVAFLDQRDDGRFSALEGRISGSCAHDITTCMKSRILPPRIAESVPRCPCSAGSPAAEAVAFVNHAWEADGPCSTLPGSHAMCTRSWRERLRASPRARPARRRSGSPRNRPGTMPSQASS